MVQICSSCYEKHSSLAEGGVPATTNNLDSLSSGGGGMVNNIGGGRYTPSDKSQANSDTSNVRFKVSLIEFILFFSFYLYFISGLLILAILSPLSEKYSIRQNLNESWLMIFWSLCLNRRHFAKLSDIRRNCGG